jgi:hypothetical protein
MSLKAPNLKAKVTSLERCTHVLFGAHLNPKRCFLHITGGDVTDNDSTEELCTYNTLIWTIYQMQQMVSEVIVRMLSEVILVNQ